MKQLKKTHVLSLNHWAGGIVRIRFQTWYDLQYITIRLIWYINALTELQLLTLFHGMQYPIYPHRWLIMYSRKNIFKANESPLQCLFKSGKSGINQTQQYSNFIHTYCDTDRARDSTYRHSVIYNSRLFNGTIVDWCSNKKNQTLWSSSNANKISMYTDVLDINWIRKN